MIQKLKLQTQLTRRSNHVWTFFAHMVDFTTNITPLFFYVVHFSSNSATVWTTFLFSPHVVIVANSVTFILRLSCFSRQPEEALLVDLKDVNNFEHINYMHKIMLFYAWTRCNNIWARDLKSVKSSTLTRLVLEVDVEMGSRSTVVMIHNFLDHEAEPLAIKLHNLVTIWFDYLFLNSLHAVISIHFAITQHFSPIISYFPK